MEVGSGFGVTKMVGPSPWCGTNVSVGEVGIGSVVDEEPGSVGVVGFCGVVQGSFGVFVAVFVFSVVAKPFSNAAISS